MSLSPDRETNPYIPPSSHCAAVVTSVPEAVKRPASNKWAYATILLVTALGYLSIALKVYQEGWGSAVDFILSYYGMLDIFLGQITLILMLILKRQPVVFYLAGVTLASYCFDMASALEQEFRGPNAPYAYATLYALLCAFLYQFYCFVLGRPNREYYGIGKQARMGDSGSL